MHSNPHLPMHQALLRRIYTGPKMRLGTFLAVSCCSGALLSRPESLCWYRRAGVHVYRHRVHSNPHPRFLLSTYQRPERSRNRGGEGERCSEVYSGRAEANGGPRSGFQIHTLIHAIIEPGCHHHHNTVVLVLVSSIEAKKSTSTVNRRSTSSIKELHKLISRTKRR
jgi:hypothetical protein